MCFCLNASLAKKCCCFPPLCPAQHPCPALCALHSSDASISKRLRGFPLIHAVVKLIKKKNRGNIIAFVLRLPKVKVNQIEEKPHHQEGQSSVRILSLSPVAHWLLFWRSDVMLLHSCRQMRKLNVSLHGKLKAFMNWIQCLFMMPIDGNVKECSLSVT